MTCACALVYVQSFNTALLLAVKHAKLVTVRTLVFKGANIEAKNTEVVVLVHIIRDRSQAIINVGAGCGFSGVSTG